MKRLSYSSSLILHPSSFQKDCRGSNCGCPLKVLPGKGRLDRAEPCPYNFFGNPLLSKNFTATLNRLYAETLVEIVIEIVEIEHRTIKDQRELRDVGGVHDQVQVS